MQKNFQIFKENLKFLSSSLIEQLHQSTFSIEFIRTIQQTKGAVCFLEGIKEEEEVLSRSSEELKDRRDVVYESKMALKMRESFSEQAR